MPQLSVIAKEGVRVFQYGNPFNLSLPILSNSSYISLIGTIGTLVALKHTLSFHPTKT